MSKARQKKSTSATQPEDPLEAALRARQGSVARELALAEWTRSGAPLLAEACVIADRLASPVPAALTGPPGPRVEEAWQDLARKPSTSLGALCATWTHARSDALVARVRWLGLQPRDPRPLMALAVALVVPPLQSASTFKPLATLLLQALWNSPDPLTVLLGRLALELNPWTGAAVSRWMKGRLSRFLTLLTPRIKQPLLLDDRGRRLDAALQPLRLEFGPLPFGPFADPSALQVTADALSQQGEARGEALTLALAPPPPTEDADDRSSARWRALHMQTREARGATVKAPSEDTVDVSVSHRQALEQLLLPGQKWRVKRMRLGLFEPALLAAVARFDGFPRLRELSLTSTGAGTLDAIEALEGSRVLAGLDVLEVNVVDIATGLLTGIAAWLSPLRLRSARALERKLNIDSAQWTLRRAPEGSWRLDCWTNLSMGRADHGSLLAALPPGELETFAIEPERLSLERHAEVTAAARAVGIKQLLIKPPVVPRSP